MLRGLIRRLVVGGSLLVALMFGWFGRDVVVNSRHLQQIEKALATIPAPIGSEPLQSRSAVGLLVGNGNHCDFFAGTVFRSAATPDSIRQHYSKSTFFNP